MSYVYLLLIKPMYQILNYPIRIFDYTFSILDIFIFECVISVAILIISMFTCIIKPAWFIGQKVDDSFEEDI